MAAAISFGYQHLWRTVLKGCGKRVENCVRARVDVENRGVINSEGVVFHKFLTFGKGVK